MPRPFKEVKREIRRKIGSTSVRGGLSEVGKKASINKSCFSDLSGWTN